MAIRDRFRRAMHISPSSSNGSHHSSESSPNSLTNNITATNTAVSDSSESSSLRKTQSARLFPWRSNDSDSKRKDAEKKSKKSKKPVHPRDKPLTAANLRHQEMLSGFNMTFGSSPDRMSQIVPAGPWDEYEGVSPCCTRNPSFDGGMTDPSTSLDGSSTSLDEPNAMLPPPPPKVNASNEW